MFKILKIDRYLIKELLAPFLFGLIAFSFISAGGSLLPAIVQDVNKYHMTFGDGLKLFSYQFPGVMTLSVVMASLLGSIMAFSRFSSDNELTAFRCGGVSLTRIAYPVVALGILISIVSMSFNEWVVPFSKRQSDALIDKYRGVSVQATFSQDKASLTLYEGGYLKKMIYAGKLEGNVLRDVSLIEYDKGRFQKITFAQKATWLEKDHWQFERGQEHLFFSDDKANLNEFFQKEIKLEAQPAELVRFEKNPDDMNLWELSEYIFKQRRSGRDVTKLELKWNEKVAMPFTCLIFMIIGMPMGIRPSRTSSGVGFGMSLLVIIGFYILSAVSRGIGSSGVIPPMLIAWMPNLITGAIGVQMLVKKAAN